MKTILSILAVLLSMIINAQCFQSFSVGKEHNLAIKTDGTLWVWGANDAGELGLQSSQSTFYTPVQLGTGNNWLKVFADHRNSFAIKTDGTLWGWGDNSVVQIGDGALQGSYSSPTQIGTSVNWEEIYSIGGSIAKKTDGTLWGWGLNSDGQLNLGTNSIEIYPTQISSTTNWQKIIGGEYHTLAIKNDGTLWACGKNDYGQLGDNTTVNKLNFVQIGTDNDWIEISAHFKHSIAIKANGSIWGWGDNINSVLGLPSTTSQVNVPTQLGTSNNWSKVSTGYYATKAIKIDGTLWITYPTGFQQIGTDTDWNFLDSGEAHFFAMKTDGTLWGMGGNDYGQLGVGQAIQGTIIPTQLSCSSFLNIEEINSIKNIKIYPNPTKDFILIENSLNLDIEKLTLTDTLGKIIFISKDDFSRIDMQSFESGIYILSVISKNANYNYKIIKK